MKAILRSEFLALVFLLATACSENAGPYENGLAAYQRGDYATALRLWRPLAERGDADAQTPGTDQNYAAQSLQQGA